MVIEGDECYLDVDGVGIAAQIVGFHGADVALLIDAPRATLAARLRDCSRARLRMAAVDAAPQPGSLIYSGAGNVVVFRTSDPAYRGRRRTHSRAPLRLEVIVAPARATHGDDVRLVRTRTVDVSAGGLRIPRHDGDPLDPCRLRLTLPDASTVDAQGRLARTRGTDIAYVLPRLSPADRSRISTFVLGWHMDFLRASDVDAA